MIKQLLKRFVKNSDDITSSETREQYGVLGGVLGIICNLVLFAVKIIVGLTINSIAVVSDAFNNLSDLGSSLVSAIGSRMSGKRADEEHPYGHGRAEYISALIISFLIIIFGVELLQNSLSEIFNPSNVNLNIVSVVLLVASVPVKLWLWHANRYMGNRINSSVLLAAAHDSLNDCIATGAVIASALVAPFVPIPIDGIAGLGVSALIIWTGIGVARNTIDSLMGKAPDLQLIESIENMVLSGENVLGMHDLMVHDYGPGRTIASVHAEVPDNLSLIEVHNIIDMIEHRILRELGVDIVIHMDPVPHRLDKS